MKTSWFYLYLQQQNDYNILILLINLGGIMTLKELQKELQKELHKICMHRTGLGKEEAKDILLRLGYSLSTTNIFKESMAVQRHHAFISDSVDYFLNRPKGSKAETFHFLLETAANNNPILLAGVFGFDAKGMDEYISVRPLSNVELMF